ncbi:MAG: YebC/PmpR family DNA-binding transcriptional regulator, partial [Luteolibacter sp.]
FVSRSTVGNRRIRARSFHSSIHPITMAGHNKWSKVKHIKARVDAVKGRVFSKCAHEIALAARAGGGDPAANARLRSAIDNAKSVSMPKENIERAIRKGTGELGGEAIQEVTYEGYGPNGIAFLVEMATDNLNRSAQDMRTLFAKHGGSIATPGSVSYQFDRWGEIRVPLERVSADRLMELLIDAGAEDLQSDDDEHVVLTAPTLLGQASQVLRDASIEPVSEKLVSIAQSPTQIDDAAFAARILKLHDQLDDYPDTVNVFTNFEISDEIVDSLAG